MLDKVQRRLCYLVGEDLAVSLDSLGHRRTVGTACLFYRSVFGRCSSCISKLVPPFKISMHETRQSASAHRYTLRSTFWRTTSHESSFFPRATSVWNSLPDTCFPTVYSLQTFKSNVDLHLRVDKYFSRVGNLQVLTEKRQVTENLNILFGFFILLPPPPPPFSSSLHIELPCASATFHIKK